MGPFNATARGAAGLTMMKKVQCMNKFESILTSRRSVLVAVVSVAAIAFVPSAQAFFWNDPTWPSIKRTVREKYPQQRVVTTAELSALLAAKSTSPKPTLIDARSKQEFDDSQIIGAIHADSVSGAETALLESGVGHATPIVVYCSVGYRSAALVDALSRRGYTDVRNYEGSLFKWANSGLPVYQGTKKVSSVHPYDRSWGKLLRRDLWSREM